MFYNLFMPRVPKQKLPPLNPQKETIGNRIAKIRKKRGLTQKELAEKIGIDRTVVANYENNRIRLYDEMVARFSLALNVSSDEILGLQKPNSKNTQTPSLRITKRINAIEKLPENRKKSILRTIDDLLFASKSK